MKNQNSFETFEDYAQYLNNLNIEQTSYFLDEE